MANEAEFREVGPDERDEDRRYDISLRPSRFDDFVGQDKIKENLRVFVAAANRRGDPLDHVLFHGPPGLGKTTLSYILAEELDVDVTLASGPAIEHKGQLASLLTKLQPRDVLFIDEIHRLPTTVEEFIYPAMEDRKLDLIIGEGPAARSVRIDLPPFTLVGATTRSGLITTPLRERFGIPMRMQFYSPEELERIVVRGAGLLNLRLTADGAAEISRRARGTPRVAGRLLRRVRDFAAVKGNGEVDKSAADAALNRLEVDTCGLDAMDRRYLSCIAENYSGGPVGVETLSAALSEQRDAIEEVIEPYLIQQGFLMRTPRGRALTGHAYRHLGLAAPSDGAREKPQLDMLAEGGDD